MYKGTLGIYLSDDQYSYLQEHVESWFNNHTVVCYLGSNSVVDIIDGSSSSVTRIASDGSTTSPTWNSTFLGRYNGTIQPEFYFILLYCNNGLQVTTDSYETIEIGLTDETNYEYDSSLLITLKELKFNIFSKLKLYLNFINDANALNNAYINEHSGDKYASQLVLSKLDSQHKLSTAAVEQLARTIYARYGYIWESQFALMEYNWQTDPLENYHKTEEHSESDTETETPTNWAKTNESLAANNVESSKNKVYGFNSASAVNESENETTFAHKNTETQTGSYERKTEYGHKIETYGNIGASPAEEFEKQRDFLMWDFFQVVFNDIDSLLTKNFIGGFK